MIVREKQDVQLFWDEKVKSTQYVVVELIENQEPWIVIEHDENDISLSIKNWENLIKLSKKAIKKAKTEFLLNNHKTK